MFIFLCSIYRHLLFSHILPPQISAYSASSSQTVPSLEILKQSQFPNASTLSPSSSGSVVYRIKKLQNLRGPWTPLWETRLVCFCKQCEHRTLFSSCPGILGAELIYFCDYTARSAAWGKASYTAEQSRLHPIQVFIQKCEIQSVWRCKSMNEGCLFVNETFQ